jgi:hypothetical protein
MDTEPGPLDAYNFFLRNLGDSYIDFFSERCATAFTASSPMTAFTRVMDVFSVDAPVAMIANHFLWSCSFTSFESQVKN